MAARILHSLTDDNPDLQKQIGCMTGIFQMFDRQHTMLVPGVRRIGGHSSKRIPHGTSDFDDGALERESNSAHRRSSEKYSHKNMQDRQRVSIESSRASFSSSSRSSSFSSIDCNRASQLEPASFDRMILPEIPSKDPAMSLQNSLPKVSRHAADIRELVKDSMYREGQGLSVKAKTTVKDSPRLQSKISDGGDAGVKKSTPADLKESLRVLAKLREAPQYHNEHRELSRSLSYHSKGGSSFSNLKDSYDWRETSGADFDSWDGTNSALKLKELPRLSLDSWDSSMRSLRADSKSNMLLKSVRKDSGVPDGKIQNQQLAPGNQAPRPPSVVAKLMGLETLPDSVSSNDTNMGSSRSYRDEDFVSVSSSFEKTDPSKPVRLSSSSKNSWKEPSSPRSSMKPMSWLPIEPAPWKQIDGARVSQKPASRVPAKAASTHVFPSVYSEIEMRVKDLEFTQSGKDLRALKQILEAMQAKGLLETRKEVEGSNFTGHKVHEQNFSSSTRPIDNRKPQSDQVVGFTKRKTVSAQTYDSPIVIMKPAKLVPRSGIPAASVISFDGVSGRPKHRSGESIDNRKGLNSGRTSKDLVLKSSQQDNALNSVNVKNERFLKTAQTSTRSQLLAKEGNMGLANNSGSISPGLHRKKLELEKSSRPPTPPDSSTSRRQSNKQQAESNSPGGRRRPRYTDSLQRDEQPSEFSFRSRNLSPHENENPPRSNKSKRGSRSAEPTSSDISPGTTHMHSPPGFVEKKSPLMLSEDEAAEFGCVPPEYSSPVSVLDNEVCRHDSPSPIKYTGKTLKLNVSTVDERNSNAEVSQDSVDIFVSNSIETGATFDFNRNKLQNIENLVQKLRRLNSSHDEAHTDYIASLCENTNPDHRYVSEILLASGLLLKDLGSSLADFQFHPSGYPINPELFLVLEQTKASNTSSKEECRTKTTTQTEKFHRKLIFDAVNEILARKLGSAGPHSNPWSRPLKLATKALNAQNLLKELCSEIEGLKTKNKKYSSDEADDEWKTILCKDVMHESGSWIDSDAEISCAVLDIERLIFKDLVNDIVVGESAGLITKTGWHKLSAK